MKSDNKLLCIRRMANGIGDWIMTASVIRHLNIIEPQLQITLDFRNCPSLAKNFITSSNARFNNTNDHVISNIINHLGYPVLPRCNKHLISHMLDQIETNINRSLLPFDFANLATIDRPKTDKKVHVAMVSGGKTSKEDITGFFAKNWGHNNFATVAEMLIKKDIKVVHIGHGSAKKLPVSDTCLGATLPDLIKVLDTSYCVVSQLDGVAHLCGHLGVPCVVAYCGQEHPNFTYYPSQIAITDPTPDKIVSSVKTLAMLK